MEREAASQRDIEYLLRETKSDIATLHREIERSREVTEKNIEWLRRDMETECRNIRSTIEHEVKLSQLDMTFKLLLGAIVLIFLFGDL